MRIKKRHFGVSGSLSYTDRASKQYKAINDAWNYLDVSMINGDLNSRGLTPADVTTKKLYMPQSYGFQAEDESRKRLVEQPTVQYNPSSSWKLTADALYSRLDQRNSVIAISDWINPDPAEREIRREQPDHQFRAPGAIFAANNPAWTAGTAGRSQFERHDREGRFDRLSISQGYGLNSKWALSQDWKLDADVWTSKTHDTKSPTCGSWPAWCRRTAMC
jgi:iron complex outermembrane receptor protein